jgi:DNA-binding NtrC family response regulator
MIDGCVHVAKLILLVHSDLDFSNELSSALRQVGFEVKAFADSMAAIDALDADRRPDMLITRTRFPDGTPQGPALARMARAKRPGIKVIITGRSELAEYAEDIGAFFPHPVNVPWLVDAVRQSLAES